MRHLSYLSEGKLDQGTVCPACPKVCVTKFGYCIIIILVLKDGGKVVYAIDGLFGLPRKKSAGVSHRTAVQGNFFFCDQDHVDQCVNESLEFKSVVKVISIYVQYTRILALLLL